MPQTITAGQLNTITLALTDLATINFPGGGPGSNVAIKNYGPGKVTISNSPSIVPSAGAANCLQMQTGTQYNGNLITGASTLLMISDTAATVVSFSYLPGGQWA